MASRKGSGLMLWRTVLLALCAAGIIHIVMVLNAPNTSNRGAFQRLATAYAVNIMHVLPPITAQNQPLPFMMPGVRYAICLFDMTRTPVDVAAILPDETWTLALYSASGDNFYVQPGQANREADIGFTLVPPQPDLFGLFKRSVPNSTDSRKINVPARKGLVIIRAPIRGPAYANETALTLERAICRAQPQ
ncbi:MAG: DUF1254 domain-containing protein [Pseudomonadota bacterium]